MKRALMTLAAVAMGGCVNLTTPAVDAVDAVVTAPSVNTDAAAVLVGLTGVDAAAYGGWDGACPGCDIDVSRMAALCVSCGVPSITLFNADATRFRFLSACAAASKSLESAAKAGRSPLLLIFYSGHGGQVADKNADEPDGADETLCLWDGQLTDDLMWQALCEVPAGVRVAFVTDSCNSASNYKSPRDWVSVMQARSTRSPREMECGFIHMGGCDDGKSSFGGDDGGVFTDALMTTFKAGISWREWFDAAKAKMSRNQVPVFAELNGFGHMPAMR